MNDFWKSYDITHAEYGADYRCYPLYGTVHLMAVSYTHLKCRHPEAPAEDTTH